MVEGAAEVITEDEAALYDRQIRLWGIDAQKRLRAANVLIIGIGGLGAEVTKNIVLAGINSLTLLDESIVTEDDFSSQFLIDRNDVGRNRAEASLARTQKLNPLVKIVADTGSVSAKADEFFEAFSVVCATECSASELLHIDSVCRRNGICFYCCDVYGHYGYMFADLGEHNYTEEEQRQKSTSTKLQAPSRKRKLGSTHEELETITLHKKSSFVKLADALDPKWWKGVAESIRKRTSYCYFVMLVMHKFIDRHKRRPSPLWLLDDKTAITSLCDEVVDELGLSKDRIPSAFISLCSGELSPVCAIVGGVAGQEIIKAVSRKDTPHNNLFLYDPLDGSGIVERIGSSIV